MVLVPRGHHPCRAACGFDMHSLNAMAGPQRKLRYVEEPTLTSMQRDALTYARQRWNKQMPLMKSHVYEGRSDAEIKLLDTAHGQWFVVRGGGTRPVSDTHRA